MRCGSCHNIPFWRWVKRDHTFTTDITCSDFGGIRLRYVQLDNVTDCFGEYSCTFGLESIIKFIGYTQKISTCFSMKKSLMIPKE
jgi:hypothetical protein